MMAVREVADVKGSNEIDHVALLLMALLVLALVAAFALFAFWVWKVAGCDGIVILAASVICFGTLAITKFISPGPERPAASLPPASGIGKPWERRWGVLPVRNV